MLIKYTSKHIKYIRMGGFANSCSYSITQSSPLKFLSKGYASSLPLVRYRVGDGKSICFWEDIWLWNFPFQLLFPNYIIFHLPTIRSWSVFFWPLDEGSCNYISFVIKWLWNYWFGCFLLESCCLPTSSDRRIQTIDSSKIFYWFF